MMGNEKYADYVPDRTSPKLLSREFLLCVSENYLNYIAYCLLGSTTI